MRGAIIGALRFVDIYIDEEFSYTEYPEFAKLEYQHKNRFKCKHPNYHYFHNYKVCTECGMRFHEEDKQGYL